MSKTILIAPFDGPIAAALAAEARASGWTVALALATRSASPRKDRAPAANEEVPERGRIDGPDEDAAGERRAPAPVGDGDAVGTTTLSYNPASFVSVSALLHAARNALGEIDAAVLIAESGAVRVDFATGKPGELAQLIEERCAGPLFISRELTRRFESRKAGKILLICTEPPRDAKPGPLAALAAGAFEGLGNGLFAAAADGHWSAYGLVDASGQGERAARFALALLEETKSAKAGRWLRFTGKAGLFGQLSG